MFNIYKYTLGNVVKQLCQQNITTKIPAELSAVLQVSGNI